MLSVRHTPSELKVWRPFCTIWKPKLRIAHIKIQRFLSGNCGFYHSTYITLSKDMECIVLCVFGQGSLHQRGMLSTRFTEGCYRKLLPFPYVEMTVSINSGIVLCIAYRHDTQAVHKLSCIYKIYIYIYIYMNKTWNVVLKSAKPIMLRVWPLSELLVSTQITQFVCWAVPIVLVNNCDNNNH